MQQQKEQEAEIYPLRQKDIKPLESTFGEINETLRDIAVLSDEQAETVNAIETNAENARVRVELSLEGMRVSRRNQNTLVIQEIQEEALDLELREETS